MPLVEQLTAIPGHFTAGDTVRFALTWDAYPATTHDCTIHAVYRQEKRLAEKWRPTKNGDAFEFELSDSQTVAMPQGQWTLDVEIFEIATKYRRTVETHRLRINPKPGDVPEQSFAEQMVESLNAYLLNIAETGHESTTIRGQSMSRMTAIEATDLRDKWLHKVKLEKIRENVARGGKNPLTGGIQFGR